MTGRIQVIRSGAAFLVTESDGPDVFVRAGDRAGALQGDRAVARIDRVTQKGPRGSILRILERGHSRLVGVVEGGGADRTLRILTPRLGIGSTEVRLGRHDGPDLHAAGDVVVAEITRWPENDYSPVYAAVVDRVGRLGAPGVDARSIKASFDLPDRFPADVDEEAAERLGRGLDESELAGREDLRTLRTITIDPAEARDHDDALSWQPLPNGGGWVGVHIADVSHFVRSGSLVDEEARTRGTSVYLVDGVIPMLPPALSNDLCSLQPQQDRFALSAFLHFDTDGGVREVRFAKTVIRCTHKLSYEEAQGILDGSSECEDLGLGEDLHALLWASRAVRERRRSQGGLDFEIPEPAFEMDDDGWPLDVWPRKRLDTHKIVEDLMIAANQAVARHMIHHGVPALYRIHDAPPQSDLERLHLLAREFRFHLPSRNIRPRHLQGILEAVRETPEEPVVAMEVLRSLAKARYAAAPSEHFGLATDAYLHFTSPIRRYPDLVVHRQLSRWLAGPGAPRSPQSTSLKELEDIARLASAREEVAVKAERASEDGKKAEFMQGRIGQDYEATVTSITSFGLFVRIDRHGIEGLVSVETLGAERFRYISAKQRLRGTRTRQEYRVGDRYTVRAVRVDLGARQIDFEIVWA